MIKNWIKSLVKKLKPYAFSGKIEIWSRILTSMRARTIKLCFKLMHLPEKK